MDFGTFKLVSDPNEIRKTPKTLDACENLVRERHRLLMSERPEALPGKYEGRPNRTGDTHFVAPENIDGTLEKEFARYL